VSVFVVLTHIYFVLTEQKDRVISIVLAVLALVPLILSYSRGPWLAFGVGLALLMITTLNIKSISFKNSAVVIMSLLVIGFVFKEPIENRVDQTIKEIEMIKANNRGSSIGLRLQMWELGAHIIKDNWLTGVGHEGQKKIKEQMIQEGRYTKEAAHYVHYHNQWINDLAKYGVLGLSLTILFVVYPLVAVRKNENRVLVWLLISVYLTLSLTDMPFERSHNIAFYLMCIYLMLVKATATRMNKEKTSRV
jgi:O-antigen ligase